MIPIVSGSDVPQRRRRRQRYGPPIGSACSGRRVYHRDDPGAGGHGGSCRAEIVRWAAVRSACDMQLTIRFTNRNLELDPVDDDLVSRNPGLSMAGAELRVGFSPFLVPDEEAADPN